MKTLFNKTNASVLAFCVAITCTQANAGIIDGMSITFFGDDVASGKVATDGSGLTSSFINSSNLIDSSNGYFIETFDAATAMTDLPQNLNTDYNRDVAEAEGCGVNTLGQPGISISEGGGGLGVSKGNVPGAARPGNGGVHQDNTCYGFTPRITAEGGGSVTVDYSGFLDSLDGVIDGIAGGALDYFGFYWGSVDTYNNFEFFNTGAGTSVKLTGTELLGALGGNSGNQSEVASNTYVNIDFSGDVQGSSAFSWNKFTVTSTGIAGEFDNVVTGLTTRSKEVVTEPTTLAIFGLGLMVIGLRRKLTK